MREGTLAKGQHVLTFVTTAVKPDSEGELVNLQLNPKISVTGPIAADRRSYPESHRRIFFAGEPPADPAERREYAREILRRIATKAFRRPVDEATLERLTDLAMAESSFERGIESGLLAILTSPRFLFRTELQPQPDDPTSRHPTRRLRAGVAAFVLVVAEPARRRADETGGRGRAARASCTNKFVACWPTRSRRDSSRTLPASGCGPAMCS